MILVAVLATNIFLSYINRVLFETSLLVKIVFKTLLIITTLFFIKKSNLIHKLKIDKKTFIYTFISLFLISFSFYNINSEIENNHLSISFSKHLIYLSSCFAVGLFEELFFRVLIFSFSLKILEKHSNQLVRTILLTSIIFAVAHFSNFLNPDYFHISVINQSLFAFSIGILFQSIYMKSNSIILIVTLHTLINYFGSYKSKLFETANSNEVAYSFDDFVSTFISIIIMTFIVVIPISFLLLKDKLKLHNN